MIASACEFVVGLLTSTGINAQHDPRNLNLPGAWVTPGEVELTRLDPQVGDVDVLVALIAPDAGGLDSLRILDDLLAKAIAAGIGATSWEPGTVQLENHGAGGLPALIATTTITVP